MQNISSPYTSYFQLSHSQEQFIFQFRIISAENEHSISFFNAMQGVEYTMELRKNTR